MPVLMDRVRLTTLDTRCNEFAVGWFRYYGPRLIDELLSKFQDDKLNWLRGWRVGCLDAVDWLNCSAGPVAENCRAQVKSLKKKVPQYMHILGSSL